jgi:hypothetical protein
MNKEEESKDDIQRVGIITGYSIANSESNML